MSIRLKIIFVVLPLLVAAVVLAAASSYFLAAASVTRIAREFLAFKAEELETYAQNQWSLLADNDLLGRPDMVDAARAAVGSFAQSILRSPTEAVFALEAGGTAAMSAGPVAPTAEEGRAILDEIASNQTSFLTVRVAGKERVAAVVSFQPFAWTILVSEDRASFYGDVEAIARSSMEILAVAVAIAVLLLLLLARFLMKPAENVVKAMRRIIESNDMSERVPVAYKDEIGQVSHTFNIMLEALSTAYAQIKHYAFDAVVAQKKEMKIRNIFQLYVPKDVIEQVFVNPERMLVGDNRDCSILFSDIRSFTSISEKMRPDELVASLNRYFGIMVDIIMARNGVVDKFIGDAIMAIFGAPVSHGNDALASVLSGLEMTEALDGFNEEQKRLGAPEFKIGVGVNFGEVTVGNIGCEKKMNYTVIGDMVNLASRLEGLTKRYHQPILISQRTAEAMGNEIPARIVDKVAVKGKTEGVKIYTVRRKLESNETKAWALHDEAISRYYARDFAGAAEGFKETLRLIPDDYPATLFLERSLAFVAAPPPADWDGVEIMTEK